MKGETIKVLLIEDSPADARLIREMLAGVSNSVDLKVVQQLTAGLELLASGDFDILLLDLTLPNSEGIETIRTACSQGAHVPIIVLTGLDDEELASRAIGEGAQDYLRKDRVDGDLLTRSIRYAIDRHRLALQLELAQQKAQREQEFRSLEKAAVPHMTSATAQSFGILPLRKASPEAFKELVGSYGDLLDLAIEQRAYKVEHDIAEEVRSIAGEMSSLKCGPRDAVEIHTEALKKKCSGAAPRKAQAYAEEARMMVLELIGNLASNYRSYSFGFSVAQAHDTSGADAIKKEDDHG